MLRIFRGIGVLSVSWMLLSGVTIAYPSTAIASEVGDRLSSPIESVCYLQDRSGQVIDLSSWCGVSETLKPNQLNKLLLTQECVGCILPGANLANLSLRGARLNGSNLNNAQLAQTSLAFGDLSGAGLQNANLQGANLLGVNLTGANLAGANLRGANLRGALLRGANFQGAIMPDGSVRN